MRIIYMHHAEREKSGNKNDFELSKLDEITPLGVKEAEVVSERYKNRNITAIVSSPYLRCKHTAEIINKYHNVPIIYDERLNEREYLHNESFETFLKRNMDAIDDIVKKYDDNSVIVCVTSGVNLTAFVCYFYNIEPTENTPWAQAKTITPVEFTIGNWDL